MAKYSVRFIHKIGPSELDVCEGVEIPDGAFADRNTLGKALRAARIGPIAYSPGQRHVLMAGERIGSFRVEAGRVVAFPIGSIWHSIILTHEGNES